MNYLITIIVAILLLGVPLIKILERELIKRITGETILCEIKRKGNRRNILLYILFALPIFIFLSPEKVTFFIAIMKILFFPSLYMAVKQLETKLYLTDKALYSVKRFRNKELITLKKFKKNELYRIDYVHEKENTYRLYVDKGKGNIENIDIYLPQQNQIRLFREMMRKNLGVYINEPVEMNELLKIREQKESGKLDSLSKKFFILMIIVAIIGFIKGSFFIEDEKTFRKTLSLIISLEYIPTLFFLSSYSYLKGLKKKEFNQKKIKLAGLIILGSMTLPFAILMKHEHMSDQRFLEAQFIGITMILILMGIFWFAGNIKKISIDYNWKERIEQVFIKLENISKSRNKKQKKNA